VADRVLLTDATHERAIAFHIGRRLADTVDRWDGPWNVDLEYNRLHDDPLETVAKKLSATWHAGGLVVPDLILHDRSESSHAANVLVLEAKIRPSRSERASDCAKLAAYLEVLDYRYAVYLEFPIGAEVPRRAWSSAPDEAATFATAVGRGLLPSPLW
jgi:hypothetical protein